MQPLVLALLAAAALVPMPAAPASVPANFPAVSYEGRSATDTSGAVTLGFPGVTAYLHFRGSALALRARASSADVWFDVSVDGAAPTHLRLREGEDEYALLSGATAGEHTVRLARRGESWQGVASFVSFTLGTGSEWLAPVNLPERKMLFIGDSVTCGELAAWEPGRDLQDKFNCDAQISYGMLLARKFSAQCHLVSYGGRGMIRDWQGKREGRNAPQFYELALPDGPPIPWDHTRYVPDAIGVALGQNDFSQGIPDEREFVDTYVAFVRKLRADAPHALIFLINSPMQNDDPAGDQRRHVLRAYLREVVTRVADPKVIHLPVGYYRGVPNNTHPTGADHRGMAAELEPPLRRALGW